MLISKAYSDFAIPPTLQLHMLRTAALAKMIIELFPPGPRQDIFNLQAVLRVMLIHDMGNILKMSFDNESPYFIEENNQLAFWKAEKEKFISAYGADDHAATQLIAEKLNLSEYELQLLAGKIYIKNEETLNSTDYNLKICAYADQRVAPDGVRSLDQRFQEAQIRYKDKPHSSINNPRSAALIDCAHRIEEQIVDKLRRCTRDEIYSVDLFNYNQAATNELVDAEIMKLRSYEI